jgi:carotenoid cleavage dioxygenase-like enzyme
MMPPFLRQYGTEEVSMSANVAPVQELPFYLRGNFAPVSEEVTVFDLPVKGAIPKDLRGLYLRNGPNPKQGIDPGHWFLGDGMVHGVRLEDGAAKWYRNRWVRTRAFSDGARFVDENGNVDRSIGVANTNVIGHAGRILALVESSFPTELTRDLGTAGVRDFDGRLTTAMTAHPKICPRTGELHFFGYGFLPPFLTYHRLDAAGRLVQSEVIEVPGPTMMHDFAVTDRHVIFMDLPIVFDIERALAGDMPFVWSDDYGARLGVMPRSGGNGDVRWFEIEPCYVFHPFNAYSEGGSIVIDVCRYPSLRRSDAGTIEHALLHRWTIDLDAGRVREQPLDDRGIEFPRVDDRRAGLAHRYGYAVVNLANLDEQTTSLVKYDLVNGAAEVRDFGAGRAAAEAVFVPASEDAAEDEGFVMFYLYDAARNGSDFVILDARNITGEPVAVVPLPQRVPFGFHGNWILDPA